MGVALSDPRPAVYVVVAPDFAAGLEALARRGPVWVLDTPVNRATVEGLRSSSPGLDVTTFTAPPGASAEDACAGVLGVVELHHGPYSQDPPCGTIEVTGAGASAAVRAALEAEGYAVVAESSGGFVAGRVEAEPSATADPARDIGS